MSTKNIPRPFDSPSKSDAKLNWDAKVGGKSLLPDWPPDQDEIAASVVRTISSGQWSRYSNGPHATSGSPHEQVCHVLRSNFRVSHVRLVPSGTAAVELALRACRISPGDEVVISGFDYPGNLRCLAAVGATPVMVDIQPNRWSMDLNQVEDAISPKTRAIIASHLYQTLADSPTLRRIADQHGIYLIEDACQAPGALVQLEADTNQHAGTIGHIGTLSFGGTKLLTAGNGGAILTDDPRLAQRLTVHLERPSDTFPLSQLQAAALLPQLESLNHWNDRRRQGALWFTEQLELYCASSASSSVLSLPTCLHSDALAAIYKFAWFSHSKESRESLLARVRPLGLPCGHGFPCFPKRASQLNSVSSLDNSLRAADTTVVLDHRALVAEPWSRSEILRQICELT